MACRVCRSCKLSHPNNNEHTCPICGADTVYVADGMPDSDIEVAVKAALYYPPAKRALLMNRRRRLVDLGYREAMLELLVESPVDVHDVEDLVEGGCPLDVAADILI